MTICLDCRYYLALTHNEKFATDRIFGIPFNSRISNGVCTAPIPEKHGPVQFFPDLSKITNCNFYREGGFSEPTGITCSNCKKGEIQHIRKISNARLRIGFICNNPECKFIYNQISSTGKCRKCGNSLILRIQNGLRCECLSCKTGGQLLFMIHEWPAISPSDCFIHPPEYCLLCEESKKSRRSIFETKIANPVFKKFIYHPQLPDIVCSDEEIPESTIVERLRFIDNYDRRKYENNRVENRNLSYAIFSESANKSDNYVKWDFD